MNQSPGKFFKCLLKELIDKIKNLKIFSKNKKKLLGFMIGNTSKVEKKGFILHH